jgi:hypothetical protein
MEITNINNVKRFHISGAIFFLCLSIFAFFWKDIHELLGRPTFMMRVGFSSTILFAMGIAYIINPAYFYCEITNRKLTIKYFKFFRYWKNTAGIIEIYKDEIKGYQFFTHNYGLTQELAITARQQGHIVTYSSISISLLSKKDKAVLAQALEAFMRENI